MNSASIPRLGIAIALLSAFLGATAHAEQVRYRYVSLDDVPVPAPFNFFDPQTIVDGGRVYGNLSTNDYDPAKIRIAYYEGGKFTVLPMPGVANCANSAGDVGGAVFLDPVHHVFQAAIFSNNVTTLVPPLPREIVSYVWGINESGVALLVSYVKDGVSWSMKTELFHRGKATVVDYGFGAPDFLRATYINDDGLLAGTGGYWGKSGNVAFRFDPEDRKLMVLNPYPGDPREIYAWAEGLNSRGDVLGYSFGYDKVNGYIERIGVWDKRGVFQTYIAESECTSSILFNDREEIIISANCYPDGPGSPTSYYVTRPGVRTDLSTLVRNMPLGQDLYAITALNNDGDMIGFSLQGTSFLLQRLNEWEPEPDEAKVERHLPPAAAAERERRRQDREAKRH